MQWGGLYLQSVIHLLLLLQMRPLLFPQSDLVRPPPFPVNLPPLSFFSSFSVSSGSRRELFFDGTQQAGDKEGTQAWINTGITISASQVVQFK